MKVLIACEESQTVCKAFRERGHEAYSCDIQEPSGGHPEWHILGDALKAVEGGQITTMDGQTHDVGKWDLLIAHPPCTYLSVAGNRWFDYSRYGEKAWERRLAREEAIKFFMAFVNAPCPRIAIENPICIMSTVYRKPNQIIQPYEYGHAFSKKTCLWLKNLPMLQPTNIIKKPENGWPGQEYKDGKSKGFDTRDESGKILRWNDSETKRLRSVTFPGIAQAMADQWGSLSPTVEKG